MQPTYEMVGTRIAEIAAEMHARGFWQREPLPPAQYEFRQAFAGDTMTFSQWLQFVFIPRVNGIIAERGSFPARSMVGTQAIREYDGIPAASRLVTLLTEFDALFS